MNLMLLLRISENNIKQKPYFIIYIDDCSSNLMSSNFNVT